MALGACWGLVRFPARVLVWGEFWALVGVPSKSLGALGPGPNAPPEAPGRKRSGPLGSLARPWGALGPEGPWPQALGLGGPWPLARGPLGREALGVGGPLAAPLAGGGLGRGPPTQAGGPLARGALGPGGPWCRKSKAPKITKLSNQPAWTPRQPPGPGIQLPGARGPPAGGARQTLNPKP